MKAYIIESEPGKYTIARATVEPKPFLCLAPDDFPKDVDDASILDVTGEGEERVFTVNAGKVAALIAEKEAQAVDAKATEYILLRSQAYPDAKEQLHALYLMRKNGDSSALDAIDAKIEAVDTLYPAPG